MKACAAGGSSLPLTTPKERNRSAAAPFNQYGAPGLCGAPELAKRRNAQLLDGLMKSNRTFNGDWKVPGPSPD